MVDYKTMYFRLFNQVSDALNVLQAAQRQAEAMYIESGEGPGEEKTEEE